MTPKSPKNNPNTTITHKIDLSGKVMGRIATQVADLLRGKNKVDFAYNRIMGDKVIVYNINKMILTGNKKEQKVYQSHSGYPGHLKTITFKQMWEKDPTWIFLHAVEGMLPKNRLRKQWLKNLTIFNKEIHE